MTISPALAGSLAGTEDTIVALSTAPGRSAIAVVRISGSRAFELGEKLITPWPLPVRQASLCVVRDEQGQVIDQALATVFLHPGSFTGENIIEISTHGGHYVPVRVVRAFVLIGAREALPGEFTRRAVLNGKLDITQAEAIGDLIDARSGAMHRVALGQLDGGLSRRVADLRYKLLTLQSLIAYDIDFPEEDDGPVSRAQIASEANRVTGSLEQLLRTVPAGEMIREGAVVVIAGEPNVGKSSLFNALLGQSRAIVTELPGTTRDAIEAFIEGPTWPLRLVDTAGLRETEDVIERMGIEVSERYLKGAHVVLICGDSDQSIQRTEEVLRDKTIPATLRVQTKCDVVTEAANNSDVAVSAETGVGLGSLLTLIDEQLSQAIGSTIADTPTLIRARQIQAITQARDELVQFEHMWLEEKLPAPVAAVHLQAATGALESLIGAVSTDDVLDRVFSSFCVGK